MVTEKFRRASDFGITLLAVPALVFSVGHVTALLPETAATGAASAAAFTGLILAYAALMGPGRRSGAPAFALGAIAVAPIWWAWFGWTVNLGDDNWYISAFHGFRLGLSDRGFGHAADIWLFLWIGSILLMIGVALATRRALSAVQPRPRDSEVTNPAASTSLKDGLITLGAIYILLTVAGNLANYLWMRPQAGPASLALFGALVGLYAIGTGPGRRTGWRAYLLCGTLLWGFLWLIMIIGYMLAGSNEVFRVFEMLAAGFVVKVEITDAYSPFATTEILRMLEIVSAAALVPILRRFFRKASAN